MFFYDNDIYINTMKFGEFYFTEDKTLVPVELDKFELDQDGYNFLEV